MDPFCISIRNQTCDLSNSWDIFCRVSRDPYKLDFQVWYKNSMSQASNHMVSHMAEDPLGRASEELVTDPHDHLNYFDVDISSCQV